MQLEEWIGSAGRNLADKHKARGKDRESRGRMTGRHTTRGKDRERRGSRADGQEQVKGGGGVMLGRAWGREVGGWISRLFSRSAGVRRMMGVITRVNSVITETLELRSVLLFLASKQVAVVILF